MSLMCDIDSRVRSKLLLTNLETAKKAEFERRRKLRLQQVRQQSCEFASKIRRNVNTEIQQITKSENEKVDEKCKAILDKQQRKIKKAMENASATLHYAQKSADFQDDLAAVAKEKEDLQNALARARGTLAERKVKDSRQALREKDTNIIDRKSVVRQIENTRSILIARLPPAEAKPPRSSPTRKSNRPVVQRSKPPDSPTSKKSKELRGIIKKTSSPKKDAKTVKQPIKRPTECTIASPVLVRSRQVSNKSNEENRNPGLETNLDSSGCYDSDSTWPPRSARVTKTAIPETIRVYNHNDGKCAEYIRPWKSVTHLDSLSDLQMVSNLEKEEAHNVRQADLDERRQKLRENRGARALKKERARHEFETMIQQITSLDKKERIRRAVNAEYPTEVHIREPVKKMTQKKKILRFEDDDGNPCIHFHETVSPTHASSLPEITSDTEGVIRLKETRYDTVETDHNDDCLRHIVDRMTKTREKLLQDGRYDSSDDDDVDVPRWISGEDCFRTVNEEVNKTSEDSQVVKSPLRPKNRTKKTRQGGSKRGSPKKKVKKVKFPRKKTVVTKLDQFTVSENEQVEGEHPRRSPIPIEDLNESFPFKEHPSTSLNESFREKRTPNAEKFEEKIPETPQSSSNGTSSSSSSFHRDVKVIVEIKGKKKKKSKKGTQAPDLPTIPQLSTNEKPTDKKDFWSQTLPSHPTPRTEYTSSSTSYNSPPEHLSPEQQNLLVRALNNVRNKNKENPKLREYIGRLLTMSRQNVSDLEVSSTSDFSIDSDIFNSRNGISSQPSRPTEPRRRIHLVSETSETDGSTLANGRRGENSRSMLELLKVMSEFQQLVQNAEKGEVRQGFDVTQSSYHSVPGRLSDPPIVPRSPEAPGWRMSQTNFFERSSSSNGGMDDGPTYDLPQSLHPKPGTSLRPREESTPANMYWQAHPAKTRRELSTIEEASMSVPRAEPATRPTTRREMALSDAESTISSISGSPVRPKAHPRRRYVPASPSPSSVVSTFDLMTSRDVADVTGIDETSSDLEEAFRSLGLNWALSTLKRTRDSKKLSSGTSSEGRDGGARSSSSRLRLKTRGSSGYKHSTPLERTPEKGGSTDELHQPLSRPEEQPPPAQMPPGNSQRERLTPPNLTLSHPYLMTKRT